MIQMKEPLETSELLAFARIVDAKSLSRAAAELAVPRATIGRRLARLEKRLGARLLRRTTRSLSLTDAGESFYRHAQLVLEAVARAEASVRATDDVLRGDIRLSVPPMPLEDESSFTKLVTSFASEHPEVRMHIDVTTRIVDLVREGYDVALRATSEIAPGLVARTIFRHQVIAVAAPSYLERYGTPRSSRDLRTHRCLTGFARGELPQSTWRVGARTIQVRSVFSSNEIGVLHHAAIAGLGIAFLPRLIVSDNLANGSLVHVLGGIVETEDKLAVVYPERELVPPHVRVFIDRLVAWAPTLEHVALGCTAKTKRKRRA